MFLNRVRLPVLFHQPQFPTEVSKFRLADGTSKVQSVVVRNTYDGKTDQLPEDWHRKLVIALAHDTVTIENERLMSNVVLNGDYGIDWQDFLQYPIAQANFNVEVTPFNATNSNCQTCEEMSQLSLVDDSTDEVWDEGTTHEFPDVLTDNDSICCNPFTIELVSYNTEFFSSVTINAAGVLTATVKPSVPILSDIIIATYRVTCVDGSYDEANVYGNITGTDSDFCYPPENLTKEELTETSVKIDWDDPTPMPSYWNWELYLTSDLGNLLQSGSTAISEVTLTGLNTFTQYTIFVYADCGGYDFSTPSELQFEITGFPSNTCGRFQVEILFGAVDISYMNCEGNIINETLVGAQAVVRCMYKDGAATVPLYFAASSPDTTIAYINLC